jgi:hypothetical protein
MASINIQFRLPDTYRGELEGYAVRGESYSRTARRLLLDLLDGGKGQDPVPEPSAIPDDLGDRISILERAIEGLADLADSRSERISAIEKKISSLSAKQKNNEITKPPTN